MLKLRSGRSSVTFEAFSLLRYALAADAGKAFVAGLLSGIGQGAASAADMMLSDLAASRVEPDAEAKERDRMSDRERELRDELAAVKQRELERHLEAQVVAAELKEREMLREHMDWLGEAKLKAEAEAKEAERAALTLGGKTQAQLQTIIMEAASLDEVTAALGIDLQQLEEFCRQCDIPWLRWLSMKRDRRLKEVGLK